MVYKQDECKPHTYKEKAIAEYGENQRRHNQGKSKEGQRSLRLLEIPNELEQYLMVRQKRAWKIIHSVLQLTSSTLNMENRHVILLDTKNWNE